MSKRIFDHIDLRVHDRAAAQKFYARLLPAVGLTHDASGDEWGAFEAGPDGAAGVFFGFTEDPTHQPGANRIAFWAESREEVDRIAQTIREAGAQTIEGPELCREYSPGYYAVFFEDPSGNKLEVCHRASRLSAE